MFLLSFLGLSAYTVFYEYMYKFLLGKIERSLLDFEGDYVHYSQSLCCLCDLGTSGLLESSTGSAAGPSAYTSRFSVIKSTLRSVTAVQKRAPVNSGICPMCSTENGWTRQRDSQRLLTCPGYQKRSKCNVEIEPYTFFLFL